MKTVSAIVALFVLASFFTGSSYAQYLSQESGDLGLTNLQLSISDKDKKPKKSKINPSAGFNAGVASIDGQVGFTFGTFAELRAGQVSFIPQITYWNADKQTNFEIGTVSQFYLTSTSVAPYVDFGLGINFYDSDSLSYTKASLIAGVGVELKNISKSFNLFIDGKYKLIAANTGNIPCFLITAGMKFPFH